MPGLVADKLAELAQRQEELDRDRLHAVLVETRLKEQGHSGVNIPEAAIEDAYAHAGRELKRLEKEMPSLTSSERLEQFEYARNPPSYKAAKEEIQPGDIAQLNTGASLPCLENRLEYLTQAGYRAADKGEGPGVAFYGNGQGEQLLRQYVATENEIVNRYPGSETAKQILTDRAAEAKQSVKEDNGIGMSI